MDTILGIDAGTTNWKAGLFTKEGEMLSLWSMPTATRYDSSLNVYYDPEELWNTVEKLIREAVSSGRNHEKPSVIGISSMAEAGLFVDRGNGKALTKIIPWFDQRTVPYTDMIKNVLDEEKHFTKTGLHPSYKYGIYKILYLMDNYSGSLENVVWLSIGDYIAFKLTGVMATDYTLAARTYAFDIVKNEWMGEWIEKLGIPSNMFPEALPSGTSIGCVKKETASFLGLNENTVVAVSGHDHTCAALAVGADGTDDVYASIGTAEVLLGNFKSRELSIEDYDTGLSYGPHIIPGRMTWLGSIQAAGGSIEWMRSIISDDAMDYETMLNLLDCEKKCPTGILYYPYLSGSGAPMIDINSRGAFIGIEKGHSKGTLLKSVLEGISYETNMIAQAAMKNNGVKLSGISAAGGGTKNYHLLQIMADVLNCSIFVPNVKEATLVGAGMMAAIKSGIYGSVEDAVKAITHEDGKSYTPDIENHKQYSSIYKEGYRELQKPLRTFYRRRRGAKI